jgi:hypothetical protein
LGVLSEIKGDADFSDSQVEDLGNLQIIRGDANFRDSILEGLGELHTIGGRAEFRNSEIRYFRRLRTIGGNANFEDSQVEDLGTLQEIGGNVSFGFSQVQNLGDLVLIGGWAEFTDSEVQDLGDLRIIGGSADFANSQVQSLGNLEKIGGQIYFGDKTNLQDEWEMRQTDLSDMTYAEGGGVGDTFSMSKMIMDNGKFIEMVIAENVSVAEFEKLYSDKGYEKRFDVSLVGFHFANPNGDTIQLIPSFHKRGEIISYAEGGEVDFTEQFIEVEDGYESYYIRKWGKVETNEKEVELLAVASITDLADFVSEEELPEQGTFELRITLIPVEKHISKQHKINANDESNKISNNTLVNVVNYMGGLNYSPHKQAFFKTFDEAHNYLMSKELNDTISAEAMLSGFVMDKRYNRLGQTNWEMLEYIVGERQMFAKGGGVGGFSSKEYDKPRGKTIYDVEVEDEDDDEIIVENYDNYDEAISAYERSKYRFPITWRTYLETQKAPFVYEGGIVLTDGTLAVQYRKGKEVKHDFNGNEI